MAINSETYDTRRNNINFKTNDFCKRGFARELKLLLLKNPNCSLTNPEHDDVAKAFQTQFDEIQSAKPDDEKNEYDFIESSGFSKWWNGQHFPGEKSQNAIDELFPGLTTKWFNRRDFNNRLQLHFASLDLFYLPRHCNCERDTSLPFGAESHCDICLELAYQEARTILNAIHSDWRPTDVRYLSRYDVCITGPKERSGYNPWEDIFDNIYSPLSKQEGNRLQADQRATVDYNLDLFETSYAGLLLPEIIVSIYEDVNPLTITAFLYHLLCLNISAASDYRDDLILDFLTSLNCVAFILQRKNGSLMLGDADFFEQKLEKLWFHAHEYYYDKYDSLETTLKRFEEKFLKPPKAQITEFTILPFQYVSGHTGNILVELFFEFFELIKKDKDSEDVQIIFNQLEESFADRNNIFEKYMNKESSLIFRSLEESRDRYYKILKITGYPESQLEEKLKEMICVPMDRIYYPGETPQKESPYAAALWST